MNSKMSKARALFHKLFSEDSRRFHSILVEIFSLSSRLGLSPGEYFAYGFHQKHRGNPTDYLSAHQHFTVHLKALNNRQNPVLLDKLLFKKLMTENDVGTSALLAYTGPTSRDDLDFPYVRGNRLPELLKQKGVRTFIVKPSTGTQGHGIHLAGFDGTRTKPFLVNDTRMSTNEFQSFINLQSTDTDTGYVMFEKQVCCPPGLQPISPTASPNIRIITLKTPDGDVHITGASVRLGRQGSVTSNAGSGGLMACINPETGIISHCRTSIYISGKAVHHHPDTGQPIVGFRIPQWQAVTNLCTRAARLMDNIHSVGWDVLITANGPILLEGNDDWGVISEQVFGDGYLSGKNRALLAESGLNFAQTSLPRPAMKTFRNALMGIK